MIKKIPFTGLFLFCFIPSFLAGQGYSYVNYNIKEGLAGSMVYCMAQDHDGFIWFGTETGLSRFDGKHFVNFTTSDGLPDNEIIRLFVDSKNRVWIIPFQNKVCYYYKGKLCTDQNDSLLKKVGYKGGVINVVENDKHEIAIVQTEGIAVIGPDSSVTDIQMPKRPTKMTMAGLNFNGDFMINAMVFADHWVQFFGISGNQLVHFMNFPPMPHMSANGQYLSKDLRIIYAHPDSMTFTTPTDSFVRRALPSFVNMARLNDSLVAITSMKYTEVINIRKHTKEDQFLENENISTVLEDREGNLWFASMGKGVYRLASRKFKVASFVDNGNSQPVYSITRINKSILIGSNSFNIWKLDPATSHLEKNDQYRGAFQGRVLTLNVVEKNNALAGTDAGLLKLEGAKISRLSPSYAIKSTFIEDDTLYVGFNLGVEKYSLHPFKRIKPIYFNRTTAIHKRRDSFYLGTLKGLYIQTIDGRLDSVGKTYPALAGRISVIKESADGTIWVGTYGNGVAGFRDGRFGILLNQDSGLTSNIVRAIYPDGQSLWVGTDKGLNKVEPQNGSYKITRYTSADGLISDIINAVYVDSNTVYVGTPAGMTWFREEDVFTNSMCVLRLTGIRSEKKPFISDSTNLQFEHFDNDIRFEFTGISFKSAGEIIYRYRLTGLDPDWRTTTDNFLNYPTLPSGGYVLELQAVNKFGVESEMLRIDFVIEKLLWEKTWFRILAVIFLAAVIWIFVAWRIRTIRKQAELRTETNRRMAELEQMALKAQMNPHFIFNSLNSIQHYMFDKDVESANRYITGFSRLIRLTLDFSSKTKISLDDEIRFLSTYLELETKRFEGKFRYRIDIEENLDQAHIFIPPMILQPYIENSIRHGIRYRDDNEGLVRLDFRTERDHLVISVEDNGVGRERSQQLKGRNNIEYQSKGMSLTAGRIDMINKSSKFPIVINISDIYSGTIVAGTQVKIRIPLPK
jgi:hypothetical protein